MFNYYNSTMNSTNEKLIIYKLLYYFLYMYINSRFIRSTIKLTKAFVSIKTTKKKKEKSASQSCVEITAPHVISIIVGVSAQKEKGSWWIVGSCTWDTQSSPSVIVYYSCSTCTTCAKCGYSNRIFQRVICAQHTAHDGAQSTHARMHACIRVRIEPTSAECPMLR